MSMPGIDPRIDAAAHIQRSRWFLVNASTAGYPEPFSALVSSSVYSARAAVECFFHWNKIGLVEGSFEDIKAEMAARIRHFQTVEYLRLHDFHRGRVEYAPGLHYTIGPFTLKGGPQPNTQSAISFSISGVETSAGNGGKAIADRPITVSGISVYSDTRDSLVCVVDLLNEYLSDLEKFLPLLGQRFRGVKRNE